MSTRRTVEARGTLASKSEDGLYPVTIITEGEGSSGRYSKELLQRQAGIFSDALSFMDHPVNPDRPWERSVTSIGGRIVGETQYAEVGGKAAVKGFYKPRSEWASFVEEYADSLGLSIFVAADGEDLPDGRLNVTEFDASDPYLSVDLVVAAGRGGQFDRASEALRLIESSLAPGQGAQRAATSVAEKRKDEVDKETLEAITVAIREGLASFVTEQQTAADAAAKAAADAVAAAENKDQAVESAVEAFEKAVTAIEAAHLLPSQRTRVLEAAKKGEDVTALIETEKKVLDEARKLGTPSGKESAYGHVVEGAGNGSDDFSVPSLRQGW